MNSAEWKQEDQMSKYKTIQFQQIILPTWIAQKHYTVMILHTVDKG